MLKIEDLKIKFRLILSGSEIRGRAFTSYPGSNYFIIVIVFQVFLTASAFPVPIILPSFV